MKKLFILSVFSLILSFSSLAQDSTAFQEYYGKYKLPEGMDISEVTIVWQDSTLNITSDMGNAKMDKLGEDSFHMDYEDGSVKFVRDSATHKVNGLVIYVQGMAIDGAKEDESMTGTSWIRNELLDNRSYLN